LRQIVEGAENRAVKLLQYREWIIAAAYVMFAPNF
jgi:hypothetical protein